MRRVLFTASTYSHIVNFHRPYLREFKRRGWQVDVACGGSAMAIPEADHVIHIPFEKSMASIQNANAMLRLRRLIHSRRYELVSCHTSLASFFTRMAVRGMWRRPKVVCTVHGYLFVDGSPGKDQVLLGGAEALAAPVTDLLLTMNSWDDQYARAHKLGRRIAKIPGIGVDFSRFSPVSEDERSHIRSSLGFGPDAFLLAYAAEFSKRKSQKVLIRALSKLPDNVGLLLPGRGGLLDECRDYAEYLEVSHRVVFPGQISDMNPWYAAADCAVSSSRSEGLPFNIMEAMYCGLPVVATDVKGNCDLVRSEQTGLLFPFGDAEKCARQIMRLIENPELAGRLAKAGRESMGPYALEAVLPQILDQYNRLIPLGTPMQEPVSS